MYGETVEIDGGKCLACGQCARVCPTGTLTPAQKGYRILPGGKLGRHPRLAEELRRIYSSDDVLKVLDLCLEHYL